MSQKLTAAAQAATVLDDDLVAEDVLPLVDRGAFVGAAREEFVRIALHKSLVSDDAKSMAADLGARVLIRRRERQAARLILDETTYPAGHLFDGDGAWGATDDPVDQIRSWAAVTKKPSNRMLLGREAYSAISYHPRILERAGVGRLATREQLAHLFGVEKVLVCSSFMSDGWPVAARIERLWETDFCLLFHAEKAAELQPESSPTFGLTAVLSPRKATWDGRDVRVSETLAPLVVDGRCGVLIRHLA